MALSDTEPLYNVTVLPASAIPVIIGVVSLVLVAFVINDVGALGAVSSSVVKLRLVLSLIPVNELPTESSKAVAAICK